MKLRNVNTHAHTHTHMHTHTHTSDGSLQLASGWMVIGVYLHRDLTTLGIGDLCSLVGVGNVVRDEHLSRLSVEVDDAFQLFDATLQTGLLDVHLPSLCKEILEPETEAGSINTAIIDDVCPSLVKISEEEGGTLGMRLTTSRYMNIATFFQAPPSFRAITSCMTFDPYEPGNEATFTYFEYFQHGLQSGALLAGVVVGREL